MLSINGRFRARAATGVDRVAYEISSRLRTSNQVVVPAGRYARSALAGQFWEQVVLPREARGDVLWSPCNFGPVVHAAHVVTIHDLAPLDVPSAFSASYVAATRARYALLLRRVRYVCTVSEFTSSRLAVHYPQVAGRTSVIRPGLDDVPTIPSGPPYNGGRYLLVVGARDPRKDLATVVEAWRRVPDRAGCQLVVVGDTKGGVFATASCPVGDVPGVVMAGRVDDAALHRLYAGALAFVTASIYEGFGLPALEAARRGCPVLASDIPAHREHGRSYEWFPPRSVDTLAELMQARIHAGPRAPQTADRNGRAWLDAAREYDELLASI